MGNFKTSWLPKFIYAVRIWEGNQLIDFQEASGGPERTATIDAGYYLPDDLVIAVAAALDSAPSASGDYTVSFDRATDKFTIATNLSYLDLLWDSGASTASGAATALGYDVTDDTGATGYAADNVLPNRFVSSQPIRSPKPDFKPIRRRTVSDSGVQVTNFRRMERRYGFQMLFIEEQNLASNWVPMNVENGAPRGHPIEFYPDSTVTANYLTAFIDDSNFKPVEMVAQRLRGLYQFNQMLRQQIPKTGTIDIEDMFDRTVS
jgi:hypothetical protein